MRAKYDQKLVDNEKSDGKVIFCKICEGCKNAQTMWPHGAIIADRA